MKDTEGGDLWIDVPVDGIGEAIVAAMTASGIDHLFFTSGSELGFYQEAIAKAGAQGRPAPRLIAVTHEYACLNAALGYAAVSGKIAATAVHVDVGTQHHGAAIHTAWRSGLPVLMTAGAPPTSYPGSMRGSRDASHLWLQQSIDQNSIVRPYTKWDHRLEYQDTAGLIISRAIQVACSPPCGPVYLSLPREIVLMAAQNARFPTAQQLGIARPPAPDAAGIREIAERLARARNPVVIAGSGRDPATVPALVDLCEMLGSPVIQAPAQAYQCFPINHPLYQGKTSTKEADVVLVIDADVPWIPGPGAPPPGAFVACVGIDPVGVKIPMLEFTADLRLTADPRLAVEAIGAAVRALASDADIAAWAQRAERWRDVSALRRSTLERDARDLARQTPIDPRWVAYQIGALLDDKSIVIDDTTHDRLAPYVRLERPGSYFHNPGSGGGWSVGAALGAKLAAPDRDVIAVTGDGFYMFATANAALWSAAHYGAPFLTVVLQNRSYATATVAVSQAYPGGYAERAGFEGGYFDPPIDFAREAQAAGAYGENVIDPADVAPALRRGLQQTRDGKPAVISVRLPRLMRED